MEIHYGLVDINRNRKTVMALGNFDGVHLGHRELVGRVLDRSRSEEGTPAVFTFDPHPLKVLQPEACPPLLLTREEKIRLLSELGIELAVISPFSENIACLTPEEFVRTILVDKFHLKTVVVGYNYTFGRHGQGTAQTLAELAGAWGIRTEIVPPVEVNGEEVSSTLIRRLLREGDVPRAARLLGYQPFVVSPVVTGERRGREMGFPTANLNLPGDLLVPANGVYAVRVHLPGRVFDGVANVGVKPTFGAGQPKNLEVHCFGLQEDIYGVPVRVEFIRQIRGEKKFGSVQELVNQIRFDSRQARQILDQAGVE